ncbi:MAG: thioredoxin domain-containing protein [Deltaproteobacteria bacterium]|nr:thioredoxin domain-containing protein [Deltaproteobacteria bacterium]
MKKQLIVLISIVFLILLFVLGTNIYKNNQAKKYGFMAQENASTFVREHSQILGKVKLVIRYAPFHKGSKNLVRILEAAKEQGKYWETLEIMYETQKFWASHKNPRPDLIWKYLPKAGLDLEKLKKDMNNPKIAEIIAQDLDDAKTLNVRKTPSFFVNGKPLLKFGSKELNKLVENEIKKNY